MNQHLQAWLESIDRRMGDVVNHCCTKGCSHCCYEPLMATEMETRHILDGIPDAKIEPLKLRVARWMQSAKPELGRKYTKAVPYLELKLACPFLENNLCSVYERRPSSCRTHLAVSNPDNCKLPGREHQTYIMLTKESMLCLAIEHTRIESSVMSVDHLGVHLWNQLRCGEKYNSSCAEIITMDRIKNHE